MAFALSLAKTLNAQEYLYEFGGGLALTQYYGDANKSKLIATPGLGLAATARYNANFRWAYSASLMWKQLRGNSKQANSAFPHEEAKFSTSLIELGARAEFNFLPYSDGFAYLGASRLSPYIAAGLGVGVASVAKGTQVAPSISAAFGIKYKLKHRINLIVDCSFTSYFSDSFDAKNAESAWLDNPLQLNDSWSKGNDGALFLSVSLTYEFGKRGGDCNKLKGY